MSAQKNLDSPSSARRYSPTPSQVLADTPENLPPPRKAGLTARVSPPFSTTSLSSLIYFLLLLTSLLGAYYTYHLVRGKADVSDCGTQKVPEEYATPPGEKAPGSRGNANRKVVEEKILDLADALGMPTEDLVGEIFVAVEHYVSPASLSSVAAQESGPAVAKMMKGIHYKKVKSRPTET